MVILSKLVSSTKIVNWNTRRLLKEKLMFYIVLNWICWNFGVVLLLLCISKIFNLFQGGRLKNIRNKNKTSWNNLCGCQIKYLNYIRHNFFLRKPLFSQEVGFLTVSNHQWFLFSKHKNTVFRSANTIKKMVKLPKGIKIPL